MPLWNLSRHCIATSNQQHLRQGSLHPPLTYSDAIFLATRGSADVVAASDVTGTLEVGKDFDAIRVRLVWMSFDSYGGITFCVRLQ